MIYWRAADGIPPEGRGRGATRLENVKMAQWTGFKSIAESLKIRLARVTTVKPEPAMRWSPKAGAR